MEIDSSSVGAPAAFLSFAALEQALSGLLPAASRRGSVFAIVRRGEAGRRERLDRVFMTPEEGVPGDAWGRRPTRNLDTQVTVMQAGIAGMLSGGQPIELFGDNLFVDLDLSSANLPAGSRLRIGAAVLEVTPKPHNGCKKFVSRFGEDALRFISMPMLRPLNLRGIHMKVVEAGEVGAGEPVEVISRP